MADRSIVPGSSFTASSYYSTSSYDTRYAPYNARLNLNLAGWTTSGAEKDSGWLQVDLGVANSICAIATQGSATAIEWTKKYSLSLSRDGITWNFYRDSGKIKVSKASN